MGRTTTLLLSLGLSASVCCGLSGCGFVMAPAQHGVARAAQLSVKGADTTIAHGKAAAKIVARSAISATQAAIDGLKPSTVRATHSERQPGPITRTPQ